MISLAKDIRVTDQHLRYCEPFQILGHECFKRNKAVTVASDLFHHASCFPFDPMLQAFTN